MTYARRSGRALALGAAVVGLAVAVVTAQQVNAAIPPSCGNVWANPATGDWTAAGMWSLGHMPTTSERACITVNGSYNVNLESAASVTSLLVQSKTNFAALVLDSNGEPCGSASLTASNGATIGKHGALLLISDCASDTMLNLGGTGLTLQGELIAYGSSGKKVVNGGVSVTGGLFDIAKGQSVEIDGGGYSQTATSVLAVDESGPAFSSLSVPSGTVTLGGTLDVGFDQTPLTVGQTFPIISGKSVTGTFSQVFGDVAGAKYLLPTYSSTGVSLTVAKADLAASPKSGPAGTSVTLTGSHYPPNDVVTLSFKGAGHVNAALGTAHADSNGAFTQIVTIPAGAVAGKAHIYAASGLVSHMKAAAPFTVG
jgi:hypothetical protein